MTKEKFDEIVAKCWDACNEATNEGLGVYHLHQWITIIIKMLMKQMFGMIQFLTSKKQFFHIEKCMKMTLTMKKNMLY